MLWLIELCRCEFGRFPVLFYIINVNKKIEKNAVLKYNLKYFKRSWKYLIGCWSESIIWSVKKFIKQTWKIMCRTLWMTCVTIFAEICWAFHYAHTINILNWVNQLHVFPITYEGDHWLFSMWYLGNVRISQFLKKRYSLETQRGSGIST